MMSQALYRKWRPQQWGQIIGQKHVTDTLRNAVVADRVAHAYLFAGPRGTGKTTMARLLAKAANCLDPDLSHRPCDQCEHCLAVNQGRFLDLIEIDAASNTSVEDVRALRDRINFSPNQGRYKVYIIDEVHMLSTAAFNALLKTLEEPPSHAIFILATTEIHKIPPTVLSRCQRHEFRRIAVDEIVSHLKEIAQAEGIQAKDEALRLVARQSTGSLRDAISLLDQLASAGQTIALERAQEILGTAAHQAVLQLVDHLLQGDAAQGLDTIHKALDAGSDPRQLARQTVEHLRELLLFQMGGGDLLDAGNETKEIIAQQAAKFERSHLLATIRAFNQAANEARSAWQPALPLEMAFMEALHTAGQAPDPSPAPPAKPGPRRQKMAETTPLYQETPPETTASPQAPPAEGDDPSGVSLELVSKNWREILKHIRAQSLTTEALVKSGSLLGVKNGTIYLGFSTEVLKSKMEKDEHLTITRRIFQQVLQMEVPVECVVTVGKSGKLPPDIDGEGMVAAALRDLGGEIVDVI